MSDRNTGTCIFFLFFNEFSPNLKKYIYYLKTTTKTFPFERKKIVSNNYLFTKKDFSFFLKETHCCNFSGMITIPVTSKLISLT